MPDFFAAGTTLSYQRSYPDYPISSGWSFKLYLAGPAASINVSATPTSPALYAFQIDAATTAPLIPGSYRWVERATNGSTVVDVATGLVTIALNVATAAAGDAQTAEEKMLAAIDAVLSGRLVDGIESYQIAGRAISKIPLGELTKFRGQLVAAVNRQRQGGRIGKQHLLEFRRAG